MDIIVDHAAESKVNLAVSQMGRISIENAYIFRITHIDNLAAILQSNGIHCRSSAGLSCAFREIGNQELIGKRTTTVVPISPGGTLSDYVPFYFTSHSPMLYNIKTGYGVTAVPMSEIVILVSSLHRLAELSLPFVFTDRHAYLTTAEFKNSLADLDVVDWSILESRDFKRDPVKDPGKFERYQAEALVHKHVPISALLGLACCNQHRESQISGQLSTAGVDLKTIARPDWYF
jgi:hypothetical protein